MTGFGSNKHPQSIFRAKKKENNVSPGKPQFYEKKWFTRGVYNVWNCKHDA